MSLSGVAFPPADITALCHAYFPLNQDELTAFASSFGNASSCRLPSRVETEVLNSHHHNLSPSPDRLTSTPLL
jgi:hypothetical protein